MTRSGSVAAMLERYGSEVTLNGETVSAVIRPLRADAAPEPGSAPYYRYTGPAGLRLAEGNVVETAQGSYAVRRAETALLGREELYVRAVLQALPDGADLEILLLSEDGAILARAGSYEAKTLRDVYPVRSFGEDAAREIGDGQVFYELSLSDVRPENGGPPGGLGEFSVEIRGKAKKAVYTGCRMKTGTDKGGALLPPASSLLILACGRTEEAVPS